jgi:excisionase family DNA binding protein
MNPKRRSAPDPDVSPREVMDIAHTADYLGISEDTLYKYAQAKRIPAFKLGNRWRFRKSAIDQWMAAREGELA